MKKRFVAPFLFLGLAIYVFFSQRTVLFTRAATVPVAKGAVQSKSKVPAHKRKKSKKIKPHTAKTKAKSKAAPKAKGTAKSAAPVLVKSVSSTSVITPPTTLSKALYRDGAFTGPNADAFYGNVQVKAVIQNGKVVDVQFLDHPQDRNTSIRINNAAMPLLTSEAVRAQSAKVDVVSGATATSEAFQRSLAGALVEAKNP